MASASAATDEETNPQIVQSVGLLQYCYGIGGIGREPKKIDELLGMLSESLLLDPDSTPPHRIYTGDIKYIEELNGITRYFNRLGNALLQEDTSFKEIQFYRFHQEFPETSLQLNYIFVGVEYYVIVKINSGDCIEISINSMLPSDVVSFLDHTTRKNLTREQEFKKMYFSTAVSLVSLNQQTNLYYDQSPTFQSLSRNGKNIVGSRTTYFKESIVLWTGINEAVFSDQASLDTFMSGAQQDFLIKSTTFLILVAYYFASIITSKGLIINGTKIDKIIYYMVVDGEEMHIPGVSPAASWEEEVLLCKGHIVYDREYQIVDSGEQLYDVVSGEPLTAKVLLLKVRFVRDPEPIELPTVESIEKCINDKIAKMIELTKIGVKRKTLDFPIETATRERLKIVRDAISKKEIPEDDNFKRAVYLTELMTVLLYNTNPIAFQPTQSPITSPESSQVVPKQYWESWLHENGVKYFEEMKKKAGRGGRNRHKRTRAKRGKKPSKLAKTRKLTKTRKLVKTRKLTKNGKRKSHKKHRRSL